jgi:hypothetical protein
MIHGKYTMIKRILSILSVLVLVGCASYNPLYYIPSFSDPLQSQKIIDVRMGVERLDCAAPHLPQVVRIRDDLRWFELYSQGRGIRHRDVLELIKPIQATVEDFYTRSQRGEGSKAYCEIKRRLLAQQVNRAAEAVLGRY